MRLSFRKNLLISLLIGAVILLGANLVTKAQRNRGEVRKDRAEQRQQQDQRTRKEPTQQ